ncbi:MAG: hypothetical protein MUC43_05595 [Pirellula sp.]|jgi:hypothetical protein|nr:hypothetical protein [Pirellula sp.]
MMSSEKTIDPEEGGSSGTLARPWQFLLLGLIGFHLIAVFAEPFHFFSRSPVQSGADADLLRNVTRPYAQFMFLDHGYFFFAPNPGPGHLLRVMTDDAPLQFPLPQERFNVNPYDGMLFPDRNRHKPRLLYHRYLMFAEFFNSRFAPPDLDPELAKDSLIKKSWTNDRAIYTSLVRAVSENVKQETKKPFARVDRLEREIPDRISTLQQKVRISDPRWIQILPEAPVPTPEAPMPAADGNLTPATTPSTESSDLKPEELVVPK